MADTSTVTIGCKLPNGMHLDTFRMETRPVKTIIGTTIEEKQAIRTGRFTVKGIGRRTDDAGLAMGYALTYGCPKEVWDAWLAANKDSDVVKKGIIFASGNSADAKAKARENEMQKSGLEPLNPREIPREFKGKIETVPASERPQA